MLRRLVPVLACLALALSNIVAVGAGMGPPDAVPTVADAPLLPAHDHDHLHHAKLPFTPTNGGQGATDALTRAPACASDAVNDYFFRAVYTVPADKPNQYATVAPQIRDAIQQVDWNLNDNASRLGATADYVYLCNGDGTIHVANITLSTNASATNEWGMIDELVALGYGRSNEKVVVFSDQFYVTPSAPVAGDDRLVLENANNRGGTFSKVNADFNMAPSAMHETGHQMGAVQNSAPHAGPGGHCHETNSTLCTAHGGTTPLADCASPSFDCGFDDYFHPDPGTDNYLSRHWNIGSRLNRFVQLGGAGNKAPEVAGFACHPGAASPGKQVTCTFAGTDDGWGVAYTVNWSDGSPVERFPATGYVVPGPAQSLTHTFASAGRFNVTLRVTDTDNPAVQSAVATWCQDVLPSAATRPCAPLLVSATPGNANVTLSWQHLGTGNNAITGYNVTRNGTALATVGAAATTYTDTTATNGVAYGYSVQAINAAGTSTASNQRTAVPAAPAVPGTPTSLTVRSQPIGTKVLLGWAVPSDGGSPVTSQRLYRGTSSGTATLYATLTGGATSYEDTSVTPAQAYYYQVSAVNAVGEGPRSPERSTVAYGLPGAPLNVVITPGDSNNTISWTAPADGGSPIISYYAENLQNGMRLFPWPDTATTVKESWLANEQTYCYVVYATNNLLPFGWGPPSAQACGTPANAVPGAPTLSVKQGHQRSTLTWTTPNPSATQYKVYRGTASGGETLLTTLGAVNVFNDTGLSATTTYFYKVRAANHLGDGPFSNEVSVTPAATRPWAPTLSAAPGNTNASLGWTPSHDGGSAITGYKVYRGTTSGNLALHADLGNVTSHLDAGLTNGQAYYYQVAAVNANGEGDRSSEVTATPATPPPVPIGPNFMFPEADVVYTSWSVPFSDGGSPILGARIYRGTTSGALILHETMGPGWAGLQGIFLDQAANVTNGVTYYYQTSLFNAIGEGPRTPEEAKVPAPGGPALTAIGGPASVVLTWTTPADSDGAALTGHKVYRDGNVVATLGVVSSWTDTGRTNGQAYVYSVQATYGAFDGLPSTAVTGTPGPAAPAATATVGAGKVTVTWTTPASGDRPLQEYHIFRGTTPGAAALLFTVGVNLNSFNDTTAAANTTYYYQVAAANAAGEGTRSAEAALTTPNVPGAPTGLTVVKFGNGKLRVNWTAPASNGGSAITNYLVYRSQTSGAEVLVTQGNCANLGNVLTCDDVGLQKNKRYYYQVSAKNAWGEGPRSAEASAVA